MNVDTIIDKIGYIEPRIVSVIGAGLSKASGMPTFRGVDGLWKQYKAEDLATPYAFAKNPKLVWEWYRFRMRILLEAKPNLAHTSLRKLEDENIAIGVITQNVDGLHEIAGIRNFVEIHGRIRYAKCTNCNHIERWDEEELAKENIELPYCPKCQGSILRPDVIWFGETLDPSNWDQAISWINNANIVLVIGTSGVVHPVASLPLYAKRNDSIVIEFNIEETPVSSISDYSIFGPCEETLPLFTTKLIERRKGELDE